MKHTSKETVMLAVYIEYQKDLPQMKNINHTALNMDKDVFNTALDKLSNERYITGVSVFSADSEKFYSVNTENIKPTPEGLLYAEKYFGIQKYDTAAEKIEYIIKKCGAFGLSALKLFAVSAMEHLFDIY